MLVDTVTIIIKAGDGGDGAATFLRSARTAKGGPDGGNGGNGGSLYFQGSQNTSDLRQFRYQKKVVAADGIDGKSRKMHGKNASDFTILLPLGTRITDVETDEVWEISDIVTRFLIAQGGKGGRGNTEFKSAINQTPRFGEKGVFGQKRTLLLDLRFIAQVGLIGLPNAGKSSLLSVLTHAKPRIGDYPFTTLEPTIGMMGDHAIADIPGLIEGASTGRGLGIQFLKHIEKTQVLVHCIEITHENLIEAYRIVRTEFEKFNSQLTKKPEIVLLTKADLVDTQKAKHALALFHKQKKLVLAYSIHDENSIAKLKQSLTTLLASV